MNLLRRWDPAPKAFSPQFIANCSDQPVDHIPQETREKRSNSRQPAKSGELAEDINRGIASHKELDARTGYAQNHYSIVITDRVFSTLDMLDCLALKR